MKQKKENIKKDIKKQSEFKPEKWALDFVEKHKVLMELLRDK